MAIFHDSLLHGLRGRVGDYVFRRGRNGQTIVARRPDVSQVEPSARQLAQRRRFRLATVFARAVVADPQACRRYARLGRAKKLTAYQYAVREFMRRG